VNTMGLIAGRSHFRTIRTSLDRIGVTEIGRKSAKQTDLGGFVATGVITDCFQCSGITPAQKEQLKM